MKDSKNKALEKKMGATYSRRAGVLSYEKEGTNTAPSGMSFKNVGSRSFKTEREARKYHKENLKGHHFKSREY